MANKGNEINLDDTIEIDDEIITVRELRDAIEQGVRAGVRKGLAPLRALTYSHERINSGLAYLTANINATRYGMTRKPMDVSEIVRVELLVMHNVTNGRGYAPRSQNCYEMRLLKKEEDTQEGLQQSLNDMDEHDRRIEGVCSIISDIVSEKCNLRRQK